MQRPLAQIKESLLLSKLQLSKSLGIRDCRHALRWAAAGASAGRRDGIFSAQ